MPGGLMQLAAFGAESQYLSGNPQLNFFKMVYRRYSNFAMESIRQNFNNTPNFNTESYVNISRSGFSNHVRICTYSIFPVCWSCDEVDFEFDSYSLKIIFVFS